MKPVSNTPFTVKPCRAAFFPLPPGASLPDWLQNIQICGKWLRRMHNNES